jgi:hypothetical protein
MFLESERIISVMEFRICAAAHSDSEGLFLSLLQLAFWFSWAFGFYRESWNASN